MIIHSLRIKGDSFYRTNRYIQYVVSYFAKLLTIFVNILSHFGVTIFISIEQHGSYYHIQFHGMDIITLKHIHKHNTKRGKEDYGF